MTGMRHREAFGAATLFLLLTWGVSGSVARPPPSSQLQDLPPTYEEWNIAELAEILANAEPQERERKLANIVEWMHQLRQQQMQDESELEGNARMAVPPPLVHGTASGMRHDEDSDDEGKGKRGSFMSLCHFKICNMGRKRNLRYNPIARA